MAISSSFVC